MGKGFSMKITIDVSPGAIVALCVLVVTVTAAVYVFYKFIK